MRTNAKEETGMYNWGETMGTVVQDNRPRSAGVFGLLSSVQAALFDVWI